MRRPARRHAQHGAATLVVVMVMFLVVAMLAAYAGRNLIFEQRVAANDVRAASAREAAEAGLEWGLAQLNAGKVDAACRPSSSSTDTFRDRYLSIDAQRKITPRRPPGGGLVAVANCVRDANAGWQCQCPPLGTLQDPGADGAPALRPSFKLQFEPIGRNGVVRLLAKGCSDSALSVCTDLDGNRRPASCCLAHRWRASMPRCWSR
jgi:type II secretory pathway pseudopilin PulG